MIIMGWDKNDPAAAELWLQSLPPGPERDPLTYLFVVDNDQKYPAQMARWVESMDASSNRNIVLNNTRINWLRVDRPAAKAWIAQCPLFSDKDKKKYAAE